VSATARAPSRHALLAEFSSADEAVRALEHLRARGYERLETYAPFPLTEEDAQATGGWRLLGILAFAAGAVGALVGYAVQWYVNARSYPLNIGGRPAHAVAAFVPATFETAVLFPALATLVTLLVALRLPRLWEPLFEIDGFERTSADRFWVAVDLGDATAQPELTTRELIALGPLRVVRVDTGS
jgi:hypothetical protein